MPLALTIISTYRSIQEVMNLIKIAINPILEYFIYCQ